MKKLLVLIVIILLVISSSFAVGDIQCDSDSNDAMDISCGGTNAASASAARTNLAVPGLATDNTYTGENDFSGGTALIPSGSSLPGTCSAGEMFNLTSATSGQRFYICETTNSWVLQGDGGGSGSSTFLGLSDTPAVADYTGHAGDYLRVNSTPDGLEFVTLSANVQSFLAAADYAAMRALLDLEAGTDFYSLTAEDTWRNSVTQTEMGYLHGVTSDIQTQINGKQDLDTDLTTLAAGANWRAFYRDGSGVMQEQAFGTAGYVWTSNGPSAAPTWQAASGGGTISDIAYDATSWNGNMDGASKNAIRDYLESFYSAGSDGSYFLQINSNSSRSPDASVDQLYPEANVWKVNQNGTESSVAIGPTGGQVTFTGPTAARTYTLPDANSTLYSSGAVPDAIEVEIDGGGSALTDGTLVYVHVPFACTIQSVTMLADASGSVSVDIWKTTYSNFDAGTTHPVAADSIVASAEPSISSSTKDQDATLTGWTTSISADDILAFVVDGNATTITKVTVSLKVVK